MPPHARHVLVAGGGVGALEVLLALRELAGERVSMTLLAPDRHFHHRPLSVGEPFGVSASSRFELAALAREVGAEAVRDALDAVEPAARTVKTQGGEQLTYDDLVLALGARPRVAVPGAVTFRGSRDSGRVGLALRDLLDRPAPRVAFVVPPGATWPLPLYELTLMTGTWLRSAGHDARLSLVTTEEAPLAVFGSAASDRVAVLLAARGIRVRTRTQVTEASEGRLWMGGAGSCRADLVVALPRLVGPGVRGIPKDDDGFAPAGESGAVADGVYAVGDMTSRPVKQGGLTTQQADAVAARIARAAGADVAAERYHPMLRAVLLTGERPLWLNYADAPPAWTESDQDLSWLEPHKIAGRRLGPWLAARGHLAEPINGEAPSPLTLVPG